MMQNPETSELVIRPDVTAKIVYLFMENIDKLTEDERKVILHYINLACMTSFMVEEKIDTIT